MHGLGTYCIFRSVLGGHLCQLRTWTSWSDLNCAGTDEGKEAWPSVQQSSAGFPEQPPVVTPTTVGHCVSQEWEQISGCPGSVSPRAGLGSQFLPPGRDSGGRAPVLGVIGTPGGSDLEGLLQKACLLLSLKGTRGLGSEE